MDESVTLPIKLHKTAAQSSKCMVNTYILTSMIILVCIIQLTLRDTWQIAGFDKLIYVSKYILLNNCFTM